LLGAFNGVVFSCEPPTGPTSRKDDDKGADVDSLEAAVTSQSNKAVEAAGRTAVASRGLELFFLGSKKPLANIWTEG
jgi:hypothetical protein